MGKIIGWLIGGFSSLIAGLISFFGRKFVVATATVSMALTLTLAFTFSMKSILSNITAAMSLPVWLASIAWFIPSNFVVVFSALVSGHICRAVYDLAIAKLKLVNSAS